MPLASAAGASPPEPRRRPGRPPRRSRPPLDRDTILEAALRLVDEHGLEALTMRRLAAEVFSRPRHPYTSALMAAIPVPDPRRRSEKVPLLGEVANPAAPPSGCYFHPRCPYALDVCRTTPPAWEEVEPGRMVRCHRARELNLAGIPAD